MNNQTTAVLVDRDSYDKLIPSLFSKMTQAKFVGFDIETYDKPHQGILNFRKNNDAKCFDIRRTIVTGFSLFFDGDPDNQAYYFNLNHADNDNQLSWEEVRPLLESKSKDAHWICHNAVYELTIMAETYGFILDNYIDTLQMCVSLYGPDEYSKDAFISHNLGNIRTLIPKIERAFQHYQYGDVMTSEQGEVFSQVLGKQSKAAHSYNGHIREISYGYGLKKAVKSFFNVQMRTFEDTLGGRRHMGELTGDEVRSYGADDAYWCVKLFHKLVEHAVHHDNLPALQAWETTENQMARVFSDIWRGGLRLDATAVRAKLMDERSKAAEILRKLKAAVRELLPFDAHLHAKMAEKEEWYATGGGENLRARLTNWATAPDSEDDWTQVAQVGGAVSNGWAEEKSIDLETMVLNQLRQQVEAPQADMSKVNDILNSIKELNQNPDTEANKKKLAVLYVKLDTETEKVKRKVDREVTKIAKSNLPTRTGPNLSYYREVRVLIYDLLREKLIYDKGKLQSDGEARGKLLDRVTCPNKAAVLTCLNQLAGVDQRVKLYLTPYLNLIDPETSKVYPTVTSMLATRRMACSNPNGQQLAKRGESTYVRGFFQGDEPDHLVVSHDWSQIELVLIGEMSGDPEFKKAYGQTPYEDLHTGATVDGLSVIIPEMTLELFKNLDNMSIEEVRDINPKILLTPSGEEMTPAKAKKYWRTEVGKASNFNYWYSGALSTVGQKLGWSSDQMWEATDRYRKRFAVAEAWRKGIIEEVKQNGFIRLPDGHRRVRFEATDQWRGHMEDWWRAEAQATPKRHHTGEVIGWNYGLPGVAAFANEFMRATQTRAANQAVNAMIQGTCATLAKRSMLSLRSEIKAMGLRARIMLPIHDEIVSSVHKDDVLAYVKLAKRVMINHPSIISTLAVDCTASVGRTFEPFAPGKVPYGQLELDEAPDFLGLPKGARLGDADIQKVVAYMSGLQ